MNYKTGTNSQKYGEIMVEMHRLSRYNENCLNTTYPAAVWPPERNNNKVEGYV